MAFYENAHLVVAAIRVLGHQTGNAPSIDKVCETLRFSLEQGNLVIRKLDKLEIIDVTEGAFGSRLFIKNHLLIENIERNQSPDQFKKEIEKFQSSRKEQVQKIKSIQAKQAEKQKNLFAEIERKLKKDLEKK